MWEANEKDDDHPAGRKSGSALHWILLFAIGGLVLLLIVRARLNGPGAGNSSRAIGKSPARLDLQSAINDSAIHLADLEGQVVLVNYWGPWCHFCLEEMPHLKELFQHWRDRKDFCFLSVTCAAPGEKEGPELIEQSRAYLRQKETDFPLYVDPRYSSRQALADLDRNAMNGYPATFILDRKGVVRGVWAGFRRGDEKEMNKLLEQLLNTK